MSYQVESLRLLFRTDCAISYLVIEQFKLALVKVVLCLALVLVSVELLIRFLLRDDFFCDPNLPFGLLSGVRLRLFETRHCTKYRHSRDSHRSVDRGHCGRVARLIVALHRGQACEGTGLLRCQQVSLLRLFLLFEVVQDVGEK